MAWTEETKGEPVKPISIPKPTREPRPAPKPKHKQKSITITVPGRPPSADKYGSLARPAQPKHTGAETVEQFLARGGQVQAVKSGVSGFRI